MKKYTLFLFIFVLSLICFSFFGFNAKSVSAANCALGDLFSNVTGQSCGNPHEVVGCQVGFAFSPVTGQSCNGANVSPQNSGALSQFNNLFKSSLKMGVTGSSDVTALQQFLKDQGYYLAKVDGAYGPITAKAVSDFQINNSPANLPTAIPMPTQTTIPNPTQTSTPVTIPVGAPTQLPVSNPCPLTYQGGTISHICPPVYTIPPVVNPAGTAASTTTQAPIISSISPTNGPRGFQVTITGSGFTSTNNKIKFGDLGSENDPNYNLSSLDGKTLTFPVPDSNYYACQASNPPCYPPNYITQPDVYDISVTNPNGTSNSISFTVTSQ